MDEIIKFVEDNYPNYMTAFWIMVQDDVYFKTDRELAEEAGMRMVEFRKVLMNERFMNAVNEMTDYLTEDSMYKVLRARLAYALQANGVKDREYLAKRYLDEDVAGQEQIIINNNIPNPDVDDAI